MIQHTAISRLFACLSLAALTGLSPLPCAAAVKQVPNGDDALAQAGKDGIIVFTYAEGWDDFSKQLALKYMSNEQIRRACGDAVIMALPCYDGSPAEQEDKLASIQGKLSIPRVLSYPAIIIFDQRGRHASTIQGRDMTAYTTESVAKLLSHRLKLVKEQGDLIEQAAQASGPSKAKLIAQAATMPELVAPADSAKLIKEADPEDASGAGRGLGTDEWKMSAEIAELKTMDAIIKRVQEVLADDVYSTKVKQTAIIRMLGQWRTMGNRSQLQQMRDFAKAVIALDGSNYHANSAKYIIENWLRAFTLETGWFPSMLPTDDTEVRMEGDIPIKDVGTYTVTIQHTGGRYALTLAGVYLYDGDTLIAKDEHEGVAGDRPKNTTYTFNISQKLSKPGLGFKFKQGNQTASEGKFIIEKVN